MIYSKFDEDSDSEDLDRKKRGAENVQCEIIGQDEVQACEGGVGTAWQDVSQHLCSVTAGGHTATLGVLALSPDITFWIIFYI